MKDRSSTDSLRQFPWALLVLLPVLAACVQVKTEPIKIEPIYIEITVNHRVQKELDDVFAAIDQASATADYKPLSTTDQ